MYGRDLMLLRVAADGSGTPIVLVDRTTTARAYKGSYAPDGRHILFGCDRAGADALCIANGDGSGLTYIADLPGYVEHWSDWGPAAP
jgi:hypothetical protein